MGSATSASGTSSFSGVVSDIVILVSRVTVGAILVAHGWQKFFTNGIDATAQGFEGMGVPAATAAAIFAATVELVGGALLIVGLFTPVVALLVVADMAGAFWYAHREAGTIFVGDGGVRACSGTRRGGGTGGGTCRRTVQPGSPGVRPKAVPLTCGVRAFL